MDNYRVQLLSRALRDLDGIYAYIAKTLQEPETALHMVEEPVSYTHLKSVAGGNGHEQEADHPAFSKGCTAAAQGRTAEGPHLSLIHI